MDFINAIKILMTSVDIHLNQVLSSNPKDDEFNEYFAESGWGTAQENACKTVKSYLKGIESSKRMAKYN